ncbi:hypothetical protein [Candidatus Photodesmus anomalopis]|uniref:hypothetical protein n=1 Tax=Candidatus Photodesmus anomalopis TaxID=28176 RepID=UPI0004014095|nr:hypothetical protein [Candidatus Photodesmus katoptron]
MNIKRIIILTLIIFITACNSNDEYNYTQTKESLSPSSDSYNSEEKLRKMSDLVVPNDFNYNSIIEKEVIVDISTYSTEKAHLSIYSRFSINDNGNYIPDLNSRILSTPLDNGKATLNFYVNDIQANTLAEIWFYDGKDPIQHQFTPLENSWIW